MDQFERDYNRAIGRIMKICGASFIGWLLAFQFIAYMATP